MGDDKERDRRSSVALNCSITDNVNGGFDVNVVEREEKREDTTSSLTFDANADIPSKKVQYVDEESDRDLFENMKVSESTSEVMDEQSDKELKGENYANALKDVFKVVDMHKVKKSVNKEEEREKDEEELLVDNHVSAKVNKSKSVDVGATWAKI